MQTFEIIEKMLNELEIKARANSTEFGMTISFHGEDGNEDERFLETIADSQRIGRPKLLDFLCKRVEWKSEQLPGYPVLRRYMFIRKDYVNEFVDLLISTYSLKIS